MKREQEEVALGPQSPLPWLDELLPSACDGAWAPDNIFNFDGNTTARQASWVDTRVQRANFQGLYLTGFKSCLRGPLLRIEPL